MNPVEQALLSAGWTKKGGTWVSPDGRVSGPAAIAIRALHELNLVNPGANGEASEEPVELTDEQFASLWDTSDKEFDRLFPKSIKSWASYQRSKGKRKHEQHSHQTKTSKAGSKGGHTSRVRLSKRNQPTGHRPGKSSGTGHRHSQ